MLTGYYVIVYRAVLKAVDEFVRRREITRCVKVFLKCFIAVVLVDVDLPYWTSKVEHLVAFAAIVSNIYCTCAETAIWELPDKISTIWRRFPLIFAFYKLKVFRISTAGLFYLLRQA